MPQRAHFTFSKKEAIKVAFERLVFWLEELDAKDNWLVGRKCANLGAMCRRGLPVPPGFALSIALYEKFVEETKVERDIVKILSEAGDLSSAKVSTLDEVSSKIRKTIEEREMPEWIKRLVREFYGRLCEKVGIPQVAVSVRSAGVESRPGMFETYLNVKGEERIIESIKKVWSSAFTTRAIAYRMSKGLSVLEDKLGVGIVKMVNAASSGIGFTIDPVTGDTSKIIIEANWGLGEGVVSGGENVDRFIVKKESLEIVQKLVGKKKRCVIAKQEGAEWEEVPSDKQECPCLKEEEVTEIAKLAKNLEVSFGHPQDMEWAIDADLDFPKNLFLLQTRNAKAIKKEPVSPTEKIIDMITRMFQ